MGDVNAIITAGADVDIETVVFAGGNITRAITAMSSAQITAIGSVSGSITVTPPDRNSQDHDPYSVIKKQDLTVRAGGDVSGKLDAYGDAFLEVLRDA